MINQVVLLSDCVDKIFLILIWCPGHLYICVCGDSDHIFNEFMILKLPVLQTYISINPKYNVGPSRSDVLVVITSCKGSGRLTFEIGKIKVWNWQKYKPFYHHCYQIFWNFKLFSSEMVKYPVSIVVENIEISYTEMTKNSCKNIHHEHDRRKFWNLSLSKAQPYSV